MYTIIINSSGLLYCFQAWVYPDLPYIIFATLTAIASVLSLLLRDTGYLQPKIEDVKDYACILANFCRYELRAGALACMCIRFIPVVCLNNNE